MSPTPQMVGKLRQPAVQLHVLTSRGSGPGLVSAEQHPTKDAQALIPGAWDCVISCGHRAWADGIQARTLSLEGVLGCPGGPRASQALRGWQEGQSQRGHPVTEAEAIIPNREDGGF